MNTIFSHKNIKLLLLIYVGLFLGYKVIPAQINPNNFINEQQNEAGLNLENVSEFCFDSIFNENGTEVEKLNPYFCKLSNYLSLLNCEKALIKIVLAKIFIIQSTFIPGNESDLPPPFPFC